MTNSKVCLMAALCSLTIFTTFIGSTQSASCCLRYRRRPLHCNEILDYTIQTINTSCDINAIIFHVPGRFVCADPMKRWVRKRMECANRKRNPILIPGSNTSA